MPTAVNVMTAQEAAEDACGAHTTRQQPYASLSFTTVDASGVAQCMLLHAEPLLAEQRAAL